MARNFLVIDINTNLLQTRCETVEQAEYFAKVETVKTNHVHVVAELLSGFKTEPKKMDIKELD